jgi:hypothetical protein
VLNKLGFQFSELTFKENSGLMDKAQGDVGNDLGRSSYRKRFD